MKDFDKRQLGRDPSCGRVSFKTGVTLTRRDKRGKRNSKIAKAWLKRQLGE